MKKICITTYFIYTPVTFVILRGGVAQLVRVSALADRWFEYGCSLYGIELSGIPET